MSKINDILENLDYRTFKHSAPVQLRFNDIDILGHVNNNAQFALFDVGKTSFYETVRGSLPKYNDIEEVIVNTNCTFMRQIHFDDKMEVRSRVKSIGEKSFVIQQILRNVVSGEICSLCETVMVSIDLNSKESKPIPEDIAAILKQWI